MNTKPDWMKRFTLTPDNPPNEGIPFTNLHTQDRGCHVGHALVEYAPGCILGFHSNCGAVNGGHNSYGWMEFRRTVDGGNTWGESEILPYTKKLYDTEGRTAMCEKAILTADGKILAFLAINNMKSNSYCPQPVILKSADGGYTWSEPINFTQEHGRVFDVICNDGLIYVLLFTNPMVSETRLDEWPYLLYVSSDNGETFTHRSKLSFARTKYCCYGAMEFLPDNRLIVYIYDENDEHNLKYIISEDQGRTWQNSRRAYFHRMMRNPQLVRFGGEYFMHGRSGSSGNEYGNFILYHSLDGINWDEGTFLRMRENGPGAYSNNLVTGSRFTGEKQRLLILSSHAYRDNQTNTIMWWLDML